MRFYFRPLLRIFFKNRHFELIFFSSSFGSSLARIGFTASAISFLLLLSFWTLPKLIVLAIIFLFLFFFFADFCPRLWTIAQPAEALVFSALYISFFLTLTYPFVLFFLKLTDIALKTARKKQRNDPIEELKETIVQILRSADLKEKLNASDKKLIESVIKFKDRIVREVMVPRVDLFSLPAETPIKDAAQELIGEGYSRIPVFHENIDNVVGVLMFKDILQIYMDCTQGKKESSELESPIETLVKNVFYTPETKKVSHLLQEFRTKQMHMAIVVDEYGGTEGVVTMEDILEEIVGEIADEYDIDEELLYTTGPGEGNWIVDARMSILDAEDIFGIHIPQEGDYDTIGGYIFHKIGSIPQKGLKIHHEDFDLEILSSSERSVDKVRITARRRETP